MPATPLSPILRGEEAWLVPPPRKKSTMASTQPRVPRQGTVHTTKTAHNECGWDQRRYWRDGAIVRSEWWRGTQLMAEGPVVAPHILSHALQNRDFCQHHGTQIYLDLGCQICRQRPGTALS
jgi:hypothetical protein